MSNKCLTWKDFYGLHLEKKFFVVNNWFLFQFCELSYGRDASHEVIKFLDIIKQIYKQQWTKCISIKSGRLIYIYVHDTLL